MFTEEFMALDANDIANAVKKDGVFYFERGLAQHTVDSINRDVARASAAGVNRNWIGGVYSNKQYYLCHMLAASQTFSSLVTDARVFEKIERLIGNYHRLKAHRYY